LKRILPIVSFILLTATFASGQDSRQKPVSESEEKIIKLYPNPAVSYITFDFQKNATKGYSIQIYSFMGKKIFESQNLTEKTTVSVSEYNRGVYIYYLRDQNGRIVESGKFQVSK
jgi:hypothetical protein